MFFYVWIMTAFMLSFFGRNSLDISILFGFVFAGIIVMSPPMTFVVAVIYCFISASILVLFANKSNKNLKELIEKNKDKSQ
ncbi:MAG: hypothetical protein KQ78_01765 [Candidatus Izimaplasma bacterium HR2]|nr:MAG: hypothetical protein KQ78_01765 [Candidatus Izimaplasma bacterium HR2]